MAKAPIAGAVKTRLMPFVSAEEAAELAQALLLDQLDHLCSLGAADLYLAFAPPDAGALMAQFAPAPFALFPQTGGDLGARMERIFESLFAAGYKKVILIGSDLTPVPYTYFDQAFAYLDGPQQRVVLGPSQDGGYYLVGLNQRTPSMFENMTWSHDRVLAQTVAKLAALGVPSLQLPSWFDIDTPDNLRSFALRLDTSHVSAGKNTLQLLRRLEVDKRRGADR
jgi:rSAM/selenodomain-associated transferase 1